MPKDRAYLLAKKAAGEPIVVATCYDYPTACIEDEVGIEVVFVGDSVGTNILGYTSESEVTLADMIHHLKAVRRGVREAYLLADMPYQTYSTPTEAVQNARRLCEQGAAAVKLEGGSEQVPVVRALVEAGIEVWGHIGFTPQTLGSKGRIQGRSLRSGQVLLQSACALQEAGICAVVLELISEPISELITRLLNIPTIGIGAGRFCDGQVLVATDLLGISPIERKMSRRYERLRERTNEALAQYTYEVRHRLFPEESNAFSKISAEEVDELQRWVGQGMPAE
jgi:3-methyl-2-oxobutanoate hydroxymethyltransferase